MSSNKTYAGLNRLLAPTKSEIRRTIEGKQVPRELKTPLNGPDYGDQKSNDKSLTIPALSVDAFVKPEDLALFNKLDVVDDSSSTTKVEERPIYRSRSISDSSSDCEGKGKDIEQVGVHDLQTPCFNDITLASAMISQVKGHFLSDHASHVEGSNKKPMSQASAAHEALQVLKRLREHQMVLEGVWKHVLDVVDEKGLGEFNAELAKAFALEYAERHAELATGSGAGSGGREEDDTVRLSEEEYDERVHDRAYLTELLNDQLEELMSEIEAIGISLEETQVSRILKSRDAELSDLRRCAKRDERLVTKRKRVRREEAGREDE